MFCLTLSMLRIKIDKLQDKTDKMRKKYFYKILLSLKTPRNSFFISKNLFTSLTTVILQIFVFHKWFRSGSLTIALSSIN